MTDPVDTAAARDISPLNSPEVLLKWIHAMADEIDALHGELESSKAAEATLGKVREFAEKLSRRHMIGATLRDILDDQEAEDYP